VSSENPNAEFVESLKLAGDAFGANDLAACRVFLEKAQTADPRSLELKRWQARLAWREGDWKALRDIVDTYLAQDAGDREMHQLGARSLSSLKQWPEAAQAWQRVTQLRSDWPEGWFQLARSQLRAGRPQAAARSAERLRGFAGREALLASSRLAFESGQMSQAAQALARLADEAPDQARKELRAAGQKGDLRVAALTALALARLPGGEAHRKTAMDMARDLLQRAVAYERRENTVEAYLDYATLAQIEPDDILSRTGMKRTLQFLQERAKEKNTAGDRDGARKTYLEILFCKPDDRHALTALGQMQMADQDWPKAAETWEAAVKAAPGDTKAVLQHARALDRAQDFAAALATWQALLAAEPENAEAQITLSRLPIRMIRAGRQAVEEHRYIAAADAFALVPQDAPEHAEAERRLEHVFRHLRREIREAYKERRFERVVALGVAAAKLAPDDQDTQRLLAQAATRTRDYAIAARAWSKVRLIAPALRAAASLHLARCHLRLGNRTEGRAVLEELLRDEPDHAEAKLLMLELTVP
jgi:predicted Zn-dependent protease